MRCEDLRARAAGLAALSQGDGEHEAALAHARACDACARALREGERLLALIGSAPPAPPAAEALRRAAAAVLAEMDREEAAARPRGRIARPSQAAWVLAALLLAATLLAGIRIEGVGALQGVRCLFVELAGAVLPLLGISALTLRGRIQGTPALLPAAAALGAFAGELFLAFSCPARGAAHLIPFHLGGVLLAAALGGLASRAPMLRPKI